MHERVEGLVTDIIDDAERASLVRSYEDTYALAVTSNNSPPNNSSSNHVCHMNSTSTQPLMIVAMVWTLSWVI